MRVMVVFGCDWWVVMVWSFGVLSGLVMSGLVVIC